MDYLFQQLNMAGTVPAGAHHDVSLASGWLKGAVHPQLAPAAIIRFKGGSMGSQFPFLARVGFDRQWSQFIDADDPGMGRWAHIGSDVGPLFSANSGSCFSASWNQLCWRFHWNPSSSIQVQIVESDRWTPSRSSEARCSRSSVQSSKGYPWPCS